MNGDERSVRCGPGDANGCYVYVGPENTWSEMCVNLCTEQRVHLGLFLDTSNAVPPPRTGAEALQDAGAGSGGGRRADPKALCVPCTQQKNAPLGTTRLPPDRQGHETYADAIFWQRFNISKVIIIDVPFSCQRATAEFPRAVQGRIPEWGGGGRGQLLVQNGYPWILGPKVYSICHLVSSILFPPFVNLAGWIFQPGVSTVWSRRLSSEFE